MAWAGGKEKKGRRHTSMNPENPDPDVFLTSLSKIA
jgi:hypothetical protein